MPVDTIHCFGAICFLSLWRVMYVAGWKQGEMTKPLAFFCSLIILACYYGAAILTSSLLERL